MFERPRGGERALLVRSGDDRVAATEQLTEFRELALSAGAEPIALITSSRRHPDPRYFLGHGKVEEIAELVRLHDAELVLVDHALSPSQERNLEAVLKCRVLDRTGLILDIFAQRAQSFAGKLQVELAQLNHLATRLVRGWTHLERQKGGIGLRGPGEKQLETDRRLLRQRIKQINHRLIGVEQQRLQGRASRAKAGIPSVALVGYTNAGKSTLFNRLTNSGTYVADQLFATLDPCIRKLELQHGIEMVLIDTVGFIRELPHELVTAFHATLDEVSQAALILHVIDISDDEYSERMRDVTSVLEELGAEQIPQLLVANKIDSTTLSPGIEYDEEGLPYRVNLSAHTGEGIDDLLNALELRLSQHRVRGRLELSPGEGRLRGRLFAQAAVVAEHLRPEGGWFLDIDIDSQAWQMLAGREDLHGRLLS